MFRYFFVSLFMLFYCVGSAQSATDSTQTAYSRPRVILLMLHLSTNKIEALKRRGLQEDIPDVIAVDEETNTSIMRDFATNFTFCPVYFFYDTCYEKVKRKAWEEVTFYDYESLDKKKKVATNAFDGYYFAEVGYRTPDRHLEIDTNLPERMKDRFQGDEESASTRNYGINLYDQDFNPIRGKFGFTDISLRSRGPLFGTKKMVFEGAAKFDAKLKKRFGL